MLPPPPPHAVFQRTARIVDRWFRGSVLLVDRDRAFHHLEGIAAPAWLVLDEPGDRAAVQSRLEAMAPDPSLIVPGLLDEALAALLEAGHVTLVEPPEPTGPPPVPS